MNGGDWQEARLVSERNRYSWQWWELMTRVEKSEDLASARVRPIWPVGLSPSVPSGTDWVRQ